MGRKRHSSLVRYLWSRERGVQNIPFDLKPDLAQALAEEKATLPVKNQSCELSGQSRSTFLMTFSPDGTKIASTHGDHTVRVTDVQSGKCSHILTGHSRTPWCVAFHPSSNDILASGCLAGEVRIWDLRGGGSEKWKLDQEAPIGSVTFHPIDQVLVIATNNELIFWDWTRQEPFVRCKTASEYERIRWVKFDPWGHHLYTGILNGSSVPPEEANQGQVSYINGPAELYNFEERQRLRDRYRTLVQQITTHQRDRGGPQPQGGAYGGYPMAAAVPAEVLQDVTRDDHPVPSTSHIAGMTFSGPHHADLDIVHPQSPAHLEAVEEARQYASDVTRQSQALDGARRYAAHITAASLSGDHDDVEREVVRVRNEHASEDNIDPGSGDTHYMNSHLGDAPLSRLSSGRLPASSLYTSMPSTQSLSSGFFRIAGLSGSNSMYHLAAVEAPTPNHPPAPVPPPRHSSLSDQPLGNLLHTQLNIPTGSSLGGSLPTDTPRQRERGASGGSQETILGSLITSAQMSHGHVYPVSSASSTQTSNIAPPVTQSQTVPSTSTGAFTSILRSRLSRSGSWGPGPGSAGGHHPSLLRSQLTYLGMPDSVRMTATSTASFSTSLSSASASSAHPSSVSPFSFTGWRPNQHTQERSTYNSSSRRSSSGREHHGHPSTSASAEPSQSAFTSLLPSTSGANSSNDLGQCIVCGHHQGASSGGHGHRNHHHHHHVHTPQPVPPPAPLSAAASHSSSSAALNAGSASYSASSASYNTNSTPSSRLTRAAARGSSGCRRRQQETHRLAAFLESEVRQAIERVRARQLDIRETLHALDQLQTETECETGPVMVVTGSRSLDHARNSQPAIEEGPPVEEGEDEEEDLPPPPLLDAVDHEELSDLSERDPAVAPVGSSSSQVTLPNLDALSVPPPLTTQGSTTVNTLSAELNRRIEHLNELERNVSEITQRLSERMRALNEERRRDLSRVRSRISAPHYMSMSERLRERQDRLRAHMDELRRRSRSRRPPRVIPEITITQANDPSEGSLAVSAAEAELRGLQETLNHDERLLQVDERRSVQSMRSELARRRQQMRERDRTWHTLQRRHLHPHYAVSILDDTINRQNDGLQATINRAIAGAFMGTGEAAVANNIVNLTYRIQGWDFSRCVIPDVSDSTSNIVVGHCKLHNDASCDISQDGRLLATFVPIHQGFPDDTILGVFSLAPESLGQCLYTKSFGPNAISVSLSPLNNYVLVGLAAKRLAWVFTPKQMVAQVFKLKKEQAGEESMEHICDLMHPCDIDIRTSHVSVNSVRWLPHVGEGVVYGTNRGDLHICRPGDDEKDHKSSRNVEGDGTESNSIRRNLMQMLGLTVPRTISTATQTIHRVRRTASTQTDAPPE